MGICKLTIKNPQKHHMAKYHCRIAGREKEKNCFTKTEFVLKGTMGMVNLIPFYKKTTSHFLILHALKRLSIEYFCMDEQNSNLFPHFFLLIKFEKSDLNITHV